MLSQLFRLMQPARMNMVRQFNTTVRHRGKFADNVKLREQKITETLRGSLPGITYISVQDISGGCGAMYQVNIEAKEFIGMTTVKQHQMVMGALKEEMVEMHGIRINTTPPPPEDKDEKDDDDEEEDRNRY